MTMIINNLEGDKMIIKTVKKHSKSAGVIWTPVEFVGREVYVILKPRGAI